MAAGVGVAVMGDRGPGRRAREAQREGQRGQDGGELAGHLPVSVVRPALDFKRLPYIALRSLV